MKEVFKSVKEWWKTVGDEQHRRKVLRREKEIKHEALRRVQVREFGGELFFCFDGIPLLKEEDLTDAMGAVVRDSRQHFLDYRLTQDM